MQNPRAYSFQSVSRTNALLEKEAVKQRLLTPPKGYLCSVGVNSYTVTPLGKEGSSVWVL